jgi:hypothetical protein
MVSASARWYAVLSDCNAGGSAGARRSSLDFLRTAKLTYLESIEHTVYTVSIGADMDSMSTRVQRWLRDEIVAFGETHHAGPSEALRRVAEEWWALQRFPALEYRDGVAGRRAALRQGPDVWEVVMVWKDYEPDRSAFHAHFAGQIPTEHLEEALAYFARFPEEIETQLDQNRRIASRLQAGARPR